MKIFKEIKKVKDIVRLWRLEDNKIGFVPTMGYLHEGHKSLIERAAAENDKVIVSIYVNPMQFGPKEDLASYPRDLERDAKICEEAGVDVIFHPDNSEMYVPDFCTYVDMSIITEELCGKSRPVHFRGVCTVVAKLFHITSPDRAYFGQKDAQQLAVIRKMVEDLNFDIEVIGCPIVRDQDGLAKSSRNTYLSPEERTSALALNQTLKKARELFWSGINKTDELIKFMKTELEEDSRRKVDYVEIVEPRTMQPIGAVTEKNCCIAIAVWVGKTRLIDNISLDEKL
ncbi:pantoate--beta-alanine ligase [Anaeromicropila populeti]|uniref:Pantothenate synthetase n=1 Tax=Anaeromicropila populeti TaxID=37658 RepID=A0A1I6JQ44_9FIRM|nr:pantoate--beta-alanine ligase [Anaeromicropila populeti]SFR81102.1 pantoate--beta-alanine ligase [Anaeromicropila populeti]